MPKPNELDFTLLFDALPEPYLVFRANDPDFTFVAQNKKHNEIAMTKPGEIIGKNFFDVFPDTSEKFIKTGVSDLAESFRTVIKTRQPHTMEALRYDIKDKHGNMVQRYWQATHYPKFNPAGELAFIYQETKDITEEMTTGRELVKIQRQLNDALTIGSVGTWLWDIDTNVLVADNRLARMFGVNTDDAAIGLPLQTFVESIHEDDRERINEAIAKTVAEDGNFDEEYRTINGNNQIRWVIARGRTEIDDETGHKMFPGAIVDVTDRRKLQADLEKLNNKLEQRVAERTAQLERSNEELQNFAYVASHDLQEPLRKIQAFSNLLQDEYRDQLDDGADYLDRMRSAAARMSVLIEDLLEFSRVTTQARPHETVDLNLIVADVIGDLEIRLKDTGGIVESADLPILTADPTQMRQLFQNLIANALKFHKPDEAPVVKIHAANTTTKSGKIKTCTITVSDNGIGFDDKYAAKVFAVFQRLHGRDNYEGTGIGLAVCRKIVERHNGTISATSQPDQGATFTITLPCK